MSGGACVLIWECASFIHSGTHPWPFDHESLPCLVQITLETKDIFIECTATDLTKAKVVLNTVCCMFAGAYNV